MCPPSEPGRVQQTRATAEGERRWKGWTGTARGLYGRLVDVVTECQEAGKLPGGDPVKLAALLYASAHGAVDLALAGNEE